MTPLPKSSHGSRAGRLLPILPAIPRRLDRKPKKDDPRPENEGNAATGPSEQAETLHVAQDGNIKEVVSDGPVETAGQDLQIQISGDLRQDHNVKDNYVEVTESIAPNAVQEGTVSMLQHSSPNRALTTLTGMGSFDDTRNLDSKSPRSLHERKGSPSPTATESPSRTDEEIKEPVGISTSSTEKYVDSAGLGLSTPLYDAPSSHGQVPPTVVPIPSSTPPLHLEHNISRSVPPQPQPTSPVGAIISPSRPIQGFDHAQNISFRPAASVNSHSTPSPSHSVYQGYTYKLPHQAHDVFTHQFPAHGSTKELQQVDIHQQYPPQSSQFLPGNQPPLTPTATPSDTATQHFGFTDGSRPSSLPFRDHQNNAYPSYHPHPWTMSHSTVQSDHCVPYTHDINGVRAGPINIQEHSSMSVDRTESHLEPVAMSEHLLDNFNVNEFSDCHIHVYHTNRRFSPVEFWLHSLMIARSPRLRYMLKNNHPVLDNHGRRHLQLTLADRFITPSALYSALKTCYGEDPSAFTGSMLSRQSRAEYSRSWLIECLAFAAAGHLLQLTGVVLRGLEIASKILNWDNIEKALSFALEGGPHRGHDPSVFVVPTSRPSYSTDSSPTTNRILTPTSSQDPASDVPSQNGSAETTHAVTQESQAVCCASDLLARCLRLIATTFPASWEFQRYARPLADIDRLPTTAESRSPLSKSRLSKIQFGDLPSENAVKSSDQDTLISSIMLSLPFVHLYSLLEQMRISARDFAEFQKNIRTIIEERERRRQVVLQSKSVPSAQRLAAVRHEWAEVGYREYVQDGEHSGPEIWREFTGIYLDPSDSQPKQSDQQATDLLL